mmetsp:Transcript_13530/g.24129  ORF Transcript_13530/g.24129 Transcript_13530/m.24129 type:complete len:186 (-) Transcript_13530:598-1155(-)
MLTGQELLECIKVTTHTTPNNPTGCIKYPPLKIPGMLNTRVCPERPTEAVAKPKSAAEPVRSIQRSMLGNFNRSGLFFVAVNQGSKQFPMGGGGSCYPRQLARSFLAGLGLILRGWKRVPPPCLENHACLEPTTFAEISGVDDTVYDAEPQSNVMFSLLQVHAFSRSPNHHPFKSVGNLAANRRS